MKEGEIGIRNIYKLMTNNSAILARRAIAYIYYI